MMRPQEQLEGSLIVIGLIKVYRFFLSIFVHFEKVSLEEFLATTHGTQETTQTIKWPCKPINF